jgi:hypothetical protein
MLGKYKFSWPDQRKSSSGGGSSSSSSSSGSSSGGGSSGGGGGGESSQLQYQSHSSVPPAEPSGLSAVTIAGSVIASPRIMQGLQCETSSLHPTTGSLLQAANKKGITEVMFQAPKQVKPRPLKSKKKPSGDGVNCDDDGSGGGSGGDQEAQDNICSICFDAMTNDSDDETSSTGTGSSSSGSSGGGISGSDDELAHCLLGCGYSFHLTCITRWFACREVLKSQTTGGYPGSDSAIVTMVSSGDGHDDGHSGCCPRCRSQWQWPRRDEHEHENEIDTAPAKDMMQKGVATETKLMRLVRNGSASGSAPSSPWPRQVLSEEGYLNLRAYQHGQGAGMGTGTDTGTATIRQQRDTSTYSEWFEVHQRKQRRAAQSFGS